MRHELVFLGKTRESFIARGISEYSVRLQHYAKLSLLVLKEKQHASAATVLFQEGQQLLQTVPAGAMVVALDVGGKQLSSEDLAGQISLWEQRGVKNVSYLIGGFLGISAEVLQRADLCLSLSKMTFTHELARLLLIEQLYRAYTIKAGEKYHK